jgi:LPS O-antigen subunit length determinant protein (WzzB/FepE family)
MKNYLNRLKVAVINEDVEKLKELLKEDISFSSVDEAKEINSYIKMAVNFLEKEKEKLSFEMQKIKKIQKFNIQNKKDLFNFKA